MAPEDNSAPVELEGNAQQSFSFDQW